MVLLFRKQWGIYMHVYNGVYDTRSMTQEVKQISFEKMGVRDGVRLSDDNLVCAVDLILTVQGGDRNKAAAFLRGLPEDQFPVDNIVRHGMPGHGNFRTAFVKFQHALELIMLITGKKAKGRQAQACHILREYFGDTTEDMTENMTEDINQEMEVVNDDTNRDDTIVDTSMISADVDMEKVTNKLKRISLSSIIPGATDVRLTDDDLLWSIDLTMSITGKNRGDAAKTLRNLKPEIFAEAKFTHRVLAENGGLRTKLLNLNDSIELIMILPGKIAKKIRAKACDYIIRILAGDSTLIPEIEANAASSGPIHRMARESIPKPNPVLMASRQTAKRARIDIDIGDIETRSRLLRDVVNDYIMIEERIKNNEARKELGDMILTNARNINLNSLPRKKQPDEYEFIYCFQCEEKPEIVKIGRSKDVQRRLYQVNKYYKDRGISLSFQHNYSTQTLDPARDERAAHLNFQDVRVPGDGELFTISPEIVNDYFKQVIDPLFLKESGAVMDIDEEEDT